MKLIAGSSNLSLARQLAQNLGIGLIECEISHFANGEKRVWIQESIRGENVILVQSFSQPVDEYIMEFLLMTDALERLGARHINAVIPWLGYSLQDKVFRPGEPIAAKVIANLVSTAHIKRVFLLDLHNSSTPGFFSIPSEHLTALTMFAEYIRKNVSENFVVASPDFGGLKRARTLANELNVELVKIDKHRDLNTGEVSAIDVEGESIVGKTVVIFDDCIVSGGTVVECAKILKGQGAQQVIFCATHGLFVGEAFTKLTDEAIDHVIVTDSIAHENLPSKIIQLPVAPLFGEALRSWM